MTMLLTSASFHDGDKLDAKHTCDGDGVSPALDWVGAPEETRSFALIVHDPDAPSGDFTHWLLYDIPAGTTTLEPCQPATATIGVSGKNAQGKTGWTPACPPSGDGMHRYMFELYALSRDALGLPSGATRQQVEAAIAGSILDQAHVEATYQRQ